MSRHGRRALLLTAAITPHAEVPALVLRDPGERHAQTLRAFNAARAELGGAFDVLVLAETSDADLRAFSAAAGDDPRIELLHSPQPAGTTDVRRGFLELELIERALAASALIADAEEVWKLSGRYVVRNLPQVMGVPAGDADITVNLRRWPRPWADMVLMGATHHGWAALTAAVHAAAPLPPDRSPEHLLFDVVRALQTDGVEVRPRLPAEPRLSGVRGKDGRSYDHPAQVLRWLARAGLRRIAPRVWV